MTDKLKVAAFTGAYNEPCARFRIRQHLGDLRSRGIDIHDLSSSFGTFPPRSKIMRPFWGVGNILQHIPKVISSYNYDVSIIQREFLSTFYTLEGLTKNPRVLDVDDAIWVYRGGDAATKLAKNVSHIICGNEFLAEWFSRFNRNITIVPTALDSAYFVSDIPILKQEKITLGWSGVSGGYKYFHDSGLIEALKVLFQKYKNLYLRIVSNNPPDFVELPADRVEFIKWSPDNEVISLNDIDIGLMPLIDGIFQRGKCSYKMLSYMSCQKPVVVSPIGMNSDILSMGDVGFGAVSRDDWVDSISYLIENPTDSTNKGRNGREIIVNNFDKPIIVDKIIRVLRSVR